jgi:hypothetical protein
MALLKERHDSGTFVKALDSEDVLLQFIVVGFNFYRLKSDCHYIVSVNQCRLRYPATFRPVGSETGSRTRQA